MAILTARGSELTIGQHIQLAMQTAGILNTAQEPSEDDYTLGKRNLQNILNGLVVYGIQARSVELRELEVEEDAPAVALPDDVIGLTGTARYWVATESAQESVPVVPMTREEWMRNGQTPASVPSRYMLDLDARLIRLTPGSLEAGVLLIQAQKRLANTTSITATLDLEQLWDTYIQFELACRIAMAKSQFVRVPMLKATAEEHLRRCRGAAEENLDGQVYLDHRVRI